MLEVITKTKCTGCTSCLTVCPKNAISMIKDSDGFLYPNIDNSKCVNCGLCKKKCPILNTQSNTSLNNCFVGYSKDDSVLINSSSGGVFSEIANNIIKNNGIVIGAAFDENNILKHIVVTKKKDLEKLKGSKYIQSNLLDIFSFIKNNIQEKKILFVGTPCQVAGLKSIIKNENLICIDIICHGVPSPKLFAKYIQELENSRNDKLLNYVFRDKTTGWDSYSNKIIFKKTQHTELAQDNPYMKLFLSDIALRESCYDCNFKLGNKYSDITLGDFWGVQKYYPEMYNKKGVSAIIINTEQGKKIFEQIEHNLIYKNCTIEEIIAHNLSLTTSPKYPKKRKIFFKQLDNDSIEILCKKYKKKNTITSRIINKIKKKFIIKKI